jgi:hypothetical protein
MHYLLWSSLVINKINTILVINYIENYHILGQMYQMAPLYVFKTKIYHFLAIFLQFRQITDLKQIDSKTDGRPHLSVLRWQET